MDSASASFEIQIINMALCQSMRAGEQKAKSRASVRSHISAPILWIAGCHANTETTRSWRTNPLTDKSSPFCYQRLSWVKVQHGKTFIILDYLHSTSQRFDTGKLSLVEKHFFGVITDLVILRHVFMLVCHLQIAINAILINWVICTNQKFQCTICWFQQINTYNEHNKYSEA